MGSGVWKRLRVLRPVKVGPGFRKEIKVDVLTREIVVDLDEVENLRAFIIPKGWPNKPEAKRTDGDMSRIRALEALRDLRVCPHCRKKLVQER